MEKLAKKLRDPMCSSITKKITDLNGKGDVYEEPGKKCVYH